LRGDACLGEFQPARNKTGMILVRRPITETSPKLMQECHGHQEISYKNTEDQAITV
jgi:hypothetical protein